MFVFAPKLEEGKGIKLNVDEIIKKNLHPEVLPLLDFILTAYKTKGENDKYGLKLPLDPKEFGFTYSLIAKYPKFAIYENLIIAVWGIEEYSNVSADADQLERDKGGLRVLKSKIQNDIKRKFDNKFQIKTLKEFGYGLSVNEKQLND